MIKELVWWTLTHLQTKSYSKTSRTTSRMLRRRDWAALLLEEMFLLISQITQISNTQVLSGWARRESFSMLSMIQDLIGLSLTLISALIATIQCSTRNSSTYEVVDGYLMSQEYGSASVKGYNATDYISVTEPSKWSGKSRCSIEEFPFFALRNQIGIEEDFDGILGLSR